MYEEKIPFKRLGTVEEGYGQERQAAGKQIQILNTGNQTVTVKAVSAEGYVVGIPEGSITISDMTWNKWLNQITFGKFFNKTQKVEITAHDTGTGIANIVYYVAEGEQSVEQLNALPNGKWNLYKKEFTVEPDGRMVVYAKITDKAGNTAMANTCHSPESGIVGILRTDKKTGIKGIACVSGRITDWRRNYGRQCFGIYPGRSKPCDRDFLCIQKW